MTRLSTNLTHVPLTSEELKAAGRHTLKRCEELGYSRDEALELLDMLGIREGLKEVDQR